MIIYQPVDRSFLAPIKNIHKLIDLDKIWISLVFLMGAFAFNFLKKGAARQGWLGKTQ